MNGDNMSQMFLSTFTAVIPLYLMQVEADLDVDLDPKDVAAVLNLPQAQMTQTNLHSLMTTMSPYGTIDDMELINEGDDGEDGC
jgi:hypothetical protein